MEVQAKRCVFVGANKQPMLFLEKSHGIACKEGEVLIKIRFATICSSDIHTITGRRLEDHPLVLGHEAVGEIVFDGRSGVHRDAPLPQGTRVTFSIAASCLQCDVCKSKLPQKCDKLFKYGHTNINRGTGFSGCYATHIILEPHTKIIPILNDVIPDSVLSTINCAMATSVNAVEKAMVGSSYKVAVVQGAGLLGIYCCALLHDEGYTVYCTDINPMRAHMATKFGAKTLDTESKELDCTVDCVIEVCGSSAVVDRGMQYLKFGGTYVFTGMVHADTKLNITGEQVIRKCATIKGIHNYGPEHLEKAVEFITRTLNKYPYEKLINPRSYKLDNIEEAIDMASDGLHWRTGIDFVK